MDAKSRTNRSITRISLIIILHTLLRARKRRHENVCACCSANASQNTEAEIHLERFFRVPMPRVYLTNYGSTSFFF